MKIFEKSMSVALSVILASSGMIAASARSLDDPGELPVNAAQGAVTEVRFTDESVRTYDGLIDVTELESWAGVSTVVSYTSSFNGEEMLSVTLNDIVSAGSAVSASSSKQMSNGFYAIDFDLADGTKEAFLTGLTPGNLESAQNAIYNSYQTGQTLKIEDLGFIDTEKTTFSNDDDNLCWAATTSNLLDYTGWGARAGFEDTDDIFDAFVDAFYDGGSNVWFGTHWFLDGFHPTTLDGFALPKNPGGSGGYLNQYCTDDVSLTVTGDGTNAIEMMQQLREKIREGCGVGLGVFFYGGGGHAISCWGYIDDTTHGEDEFERYEALIISDSDSDEQEMRNRRAAPNVLNVLNTVAVTVDGIVYRPGDSMIDAALQRTGNLPDDEYDPDAPVDEGDPDIYWQMHNYESPASIQTISYLEPYRDDFPVETAADATKDLYHNPDFLVDGAMISGFGDDAENARSALAHAPLYLYMTVANLSDAAFDGALTAKVTILGEDGETVYTQEFTDNTSIAPMNESEDYLFGVRLGAYLDAGSYSAKIEVNADHSVAEAYFANNSFECQFTVEDFDIDLSAVNARVTNTLFNTDDECRVEMAYDGLETIADRLADAAMTYCPGFLMDDNEGGFFMDWDMWEDVYLDEAIETVGVTGEIRLPSVFTVPAGEKMKFCLNLSFNDGTPKAHIFTEICDVNTFDLSVIPDADSADKIVIEPGSTRFEDGKQISFTVKNNADTFYGDFSGSYTVIASNDSDEMTLVEATPLALKNGESSVPIVITELPAVLPSANDDFTVNVILTGTAADDINIGSVFKPVSVLVPHDTPSIVVTTKQDTIDEFDHKTSLREAIAAYDGEGEITFDFDAITAEETDNIFTSFSMSVYLDSDLGSITVDKSLAINGFCMDTKKVEQFTDETEEEIMFVDTDEETACITEIYLGANRFIVNKGAALTLHNLRMNNSAMTKEDYPDFGGIILNNGGDVTLDRCILSGGSANVSGGGIYSKGGTLKLSNTQFVACYAVYGGALTVEKGAQADVLNGRFERIYGKYSAIQNSNSTLNLVNCSVYGSTLSGAEYPAAAVRSGGETKLVNCLLYCNGDCDVSGSATLYGCCVRNAADGVKDDSMLKQIEHTSDVHTLKVDLNFVTAKPAAYLASYVLFASHSERLEGDLPHLKRAVVGTGMKVVVRDGMLSYTPDGETFYDSSVPAAFGEEMYGKDFTGAERAFDYGCLSDYREAEPILPGDVNLDGTVDIADATNLQMLIAGLSGMNGDQIAAAAIELYEPGDLDDEEIFSVVTVTRIQKYVAGLTDVL